MKIDTLQGTMTAEAWHVGKHVAADPGGYNWRIMDEDVDDVIQVLENPGAKCVILDDFTTSRVKVMHNEDGSVVIRALSLDPVSGMYVGDDVVLSDAGRLQFLDVLRSVAQRPSGVKKSLRDDLNRWLKGRGK